MVDERPTPFLCQDIVLEILSRLPDKPLFRARCVSTSWRSLIDANLRWWRALPRAMEGFFYIADFYEYGFIHQLKFLSMSTTDDDGSSSTRDTSLSFIPGERRIVDSSNGMLLCAYGLPSQLHYTHRFVINNYCVCNPATKRWAPVPAVPHCCETLLLAFDPVVSPHYKIFMLWSTLCPTIEKYLKVFSSELGDWRCLGRLADYVYLNLPHPEYKLYLHGKLYLARLDCLLILDVTEESHRSMGMPAGITSDFCFGQLGGKVCCAYLDYNELIVWELVSSTGANGEELEWVLKHSSVVRTLPRRRNPNQGRIFGFHQEQEIVYIKRCDGVVAYDLETQEEQDDVRRWRVRTHVPSCQLPYSPCLVDP